jgi:hypothetical protein
MRIFTPLLALILLTSRVTGAQEQKPSAEIGTSLGVTLLTAGGNTITTVGIPVDAGPLPLFARPALYATFFPSRSLLIEPQLAFTNISGGGGGSFTMFLLVAQAGYLFTPTQRHSPYLGANVAFSTISANGALNGLGLGAAVGYRFRVGTGFAIRIEGHYRRWLNDYDGLNEIGVVLGLGGII